MVKRYGFFDNSVAFRTSPASCVRLGRKICRAVLPLALILLAACTYGGPSQLPLGRELTWFSYLSGDDIRNDCAPGRAFRYRLVYNADYEEQVRSYEVVWDGGTGAVLTSRVRGGSGPDLSAVGLGGIFAGQSSRTERTSLDADQLKALDDALAASDAFGPAPEGLRLYSDQYYWISALCRDGTFSFNAWLHPSERFLGLKFPSVLAAADQTGVPFRAPREVVPINRFGGQPRDKNGKVFFQIRVGRNGLQR